jgi:hypothetical protein
LVIVCAALLAGPALAQSIFHKEGLGGTLGAKLLDVAPDTIGLRYRMRVNESAGHVNKKMVFMGVRTATPDAPAGSGQGTLDMDMMTDWVEYEDDLGHAGWPEQGIRHRNEPSLWVRNIDYGGIGRVGLRPLSPEAQRLFPRQCAGIDRVQGARAGLTSIAAIHQGSILERDVQITLVRQPLMDLPTGPGWGHRFTPNGAVTPLLPGGTYWPWLLTVETDGDPVARMLFLVDEMRGRYIVVDGGMSIRTEFFFRPDMWTNLLGRLQLFIWDVETLQEGATTWEPRTRWQYGEDATPNDPAAGYGFRTATYRGQRVLEVSYLSFGDYARLGDVLDVGR